MCDLICMNGNSVGLTLALNKWLKPFSQLTAKTRTQPQ